MSPVRLPIQPIPGMRPGASVLRKEVTEFQRPLYLAKHMPSVFGAVRVAPAQLAPAGRPQPARTGA